MKPNFLDQYERQLEVEYKGERYLVRDNGAIYRTSRPGHRRRKLDDDWTFGRPDESTGYMHIGSDVVHRIVALAFHEQPSKEYVVDHIDTNRRNNRADNLRWVTRLENLLLNPITRAKIVSAYGSLDAFFNDPSAMGERVPDYSWMRTVSREEAEESRKRLLKWAESDPQPRGGRLGEWLYGPGPSGAAEQTTTDKQSLTAMAIQRQWKTLSEFPSCPDSVGADPLGKYAAGLQPSGRVFSRNTFGVTLTEVVGRNAGVLAVLCRMPELSVKDWALSTVTVENAKFVHESVGTYFTREGALNAYNRLLGIDAPHEKTIDDYC